MSIKKIAVIGAGVMGTDVALNLSCYDYSIILKDISNNALEKAKNNIIKNFRMYKMMKKEFKELSLDFIQSKIEFTTSYSGFDSVDLVIENVNEDLDIKERVYNDLRERCSKKTFFAINTSCISITKIASYLPNPGNVIGMHFMNPVPLKQLVEVIRGYHTTKETEEHLTKFLKRIEKKPVVVNDYSGFVANRLSHLFMNEAAFLVQDGVAEPIQIDMIFKQGYGHKMGPLETADLIGLDTVVNSLNILYENYQDMKFRCCPLLKKMIDAGLLGKKSGKGFYDYK